MSDILKICKIHGELTIDQVYAKKDTHRYRFKCKECEKNANAIAHKRHLAKIQKSETHIVYICKKHGELTIDKLTKTTKKCRACSTDKHIKWQNKNPLKIKEYQEKQKIKSRHKYHITNRKCYLKYKYNISPEQYNEMLEKQNGVCAICGKRETTIEGNSQVLKPLCVDHCHRTGKIRGLLCNKHNPMIGYADDDPIILEKGAEYLRRQS